MTLTQTIRRLAARSTGMSTRDVPGTDCQRVGTACFKLAARGELFRAKLGARHVRYFTDPGLRDALAERVRIEACSGTYGLGSPQADHVRRAPFADDAPTVIPPHVVVQQCPVFEPRFREHEHPNVFNAIQRGRVAA